MADLACVGVAPDPTRTARGKAGATGTRLCTGGFGTPGDLIDARAPTR